MSRDKYGMVDEQLRFIMFKVSSLVLIILKRTRVFSKFIEILEVNS